MTAIEEDPLIVTVEDEGDGEGDYSSLFDASSAGTFPYTSSTSFVPFVPKQIDLTQDDYVPSMSEAAMRVLRLSNFFFFLQVTAI